MKLNEEAGEYMRKAGTYRFRGREHRCDCDVQIGLRKRYLLANLPDQYQRLSWKDFQGSEAVTEAVETYLDNWQINKFNGMGLEFRGKALGVGKTFAATHIGKELVKRDESVYFIEFRDLIAAYSSSEGRALEQRLRETNIVILDEVKVGGSDKQHALFSEQFESLIRYRTNFNATTIITTNLTDEELAQVYPRQYSLLSAKQFRIDMNGGDFRMSNLEKENMELAANGEIRPIT